MVDWIPCGACLAFLSIVSCGLSRNSSQEDLERHGKTAVSQTSASDFGKEGSSDAFETEDIKPELPETITWTRSGKSPTMSMIKKALSEQGIGMKSFSQHGKPLALGDSRFVSVVFPGDASADPIPTVLVLSENGGKAQIEGMIELAPTEGIFVYTSYPSIAERKAGDLDNDGEPEAWFFLRYNTPPEPAVGSTAIGEYFIIDVDPSPRIVFKTISSRDPMAYADWHVAETVRYGDENSDGHPDVIVKGKRCLSVYDEVKGDDVDQCEKTRRVYLWDAGTDSWIKATP